MRKVLSIAFGLLFSLFAAFQYNDPDPEVWIPIYGFAAIASLMAYNRRGKPWMYLAMALIYLIAAVRQWPPAYEGVLFGEMSMRSINIELARESLGLGICCLAMVILAVLTRPERVV